MGSAVSSKPVAVNLELDVVGLNHMPRKAIDSRIPALIRNGVQEKKRSFFVVVGDRAKDVIVHLHYIMASVDMRQNKSVLWAYKKDLLGFSSHRKKREAKIKKEVKRGIRDANTEDPFELFVTLNNIRYVFYKETDKILGNTYGMCILQDFDALTPNLLARTIETVEGGGLVVLLLKGMRSLKQLYTMSMDVHARYRTEAHDDVVARFNERFILSLGSCQSCLVVDDELNVLPISGGKNVQPLPPVVSEADDAADPRKAELKAIKDAKADSQPVGSLITLAKTIDQAQALLQFVDAISEKTLQSTNLKTFFDFVLKGFDTLGYLDHTDYTLLQSTNPDYHKALVRINVHRQHRQTIQYIQPQDAHVLGQAELVVIDEAAAIPLPLVRKLIGPYLVFMASTINGYEGTGRSLSLKLIQQLRQQSRGGSKEPKSFTGGRKLREITLSEPIRYAAGDAVEKWLNKVLCLDATLPRAKTNVHGTPHPSACQLVHVNRDTLFSFHPVSEQFLQQMMALYVASHYKNSPNDLQLMSDAPAHQLFVLIPPVKEDATALPEPLCVLQVALEGRISRQSVLNSLTRGQRAGGDLIPWLVSQQFQDSEFAGLSGSRVVRIATNPDYLSMGYGSRALELLVDFYERKFNADLLDDDVKVRDISKMPPLFSKLDERQPDQLDYLGVSYGLTQQLHKFWKRASFVPVYLRQTANELTGEHSCVMLRPLSTPTSNDSSWLAAYAQDFQRRFLTLLSYQFRTFPAVQSLSISESASRASDADAAKALTKAGLDDIFSPFDLARLDSYANNMLDYHVILDLMPPIAHLYFTRRLSTPPCSVNLSGVQQSILLAIGLQRKDLTELENELNVASNQLLAMFVKVVRKISTAFRALQEKAVDESLGEKRGATSANGIQKHVEAPQESDLHRVPRQQPSEKSQDQITASSNGVDDRVRAQQRAQIDALPLHEFELPDANGAEHKKPKLPAEDDGSSSEDDQDAQDVVSGDQDAEDANNANGESSGAPKRKASDAGLDDDSNAIGSLLFEDTTAQDVDLSTYKEKKRKMNERKRAQNPEIGQKKR
ncbi:hypothetical protein DV737_g4039, partial [Chaetothyriales sp. CBS 132003]